MLLAYLPLLGILVSCGLLAGFAAGLLGVGGGIVTVPVAQPDTHLPWITVGFVSLAGLAIVGPASMLTASWGARAAYSLSRRSLSLAFGVFLVIVAARMIWRAVV